MTFSARLLAGMGIFILSAGHVVAATDVPFMATIATAPHPLLST